MQSVTKRGWVVCLIAALFFSYELVQFHMLNSISTNLLQDLNMTGTEFGFLCSTYLLADVIFLLPAGIILDHFSPKKTILTALFICILGTVGFSYSHSLTSACFYHFLSGIGNAFSLLSCIMLVSKWFPIEKHPFVIGMVVTVGMLGGVVAQTPFSLLAQWLDWRNALLVNALVGCGIFALIYTFVIDQPKGYKIARQKEATPSFWTGIKLSLWNKQNILCGLYTGFMNLPIMLLGAMWGSLFLTQVHHLDLSSASFVAGLICTGTIIGFPVFGRLAEITQQKRPLMMIGATCSLVVTLMIMYSFPLSFLTLSVLFFLLGFFTSNQILGYPLITETCPKGLTGTSMGVAAVIIMGLAGLAQPLSGMLMDFSWDGSYTNKIPQYTYHNFLMLFWIFPVGFVLSFLSACLVVDKKAAVPCANDLF